jgi:class 3 adenylate cyclase
MTIPEEIEQLKIKLEQTTDEKEQAEVLMDLLEKYDAIRGADSQPYIDWLLRIAEKLSEPLYKAWGLYRLSAFMRHKGEYDASIDLSQQGLTLFEKIGNKRGMADSYNSIGVAYFQQGNYPEALNNHFASLKIGEEIGDNIGIANAYNNIALVYAGQCNYPEALKNHFASLKIKEEVGNKRGIASSYNNIGVLYTAQVNYSQALKSYLKALKIREEIGDKSGIASCYNNIGNIYTDQGNYPEALKNHFAALEIYEETGNKLGIASCYNSIGNVYMAQANYPEALKNHFTALKIFGEIGNKSGITTLYNNIGSVYLKQGNYTEALKALLLSLQKAEEISYKGAIKESSLALSNVNKALGDFENALKYFEKYHEVEKDMLGEESTKQLNNLNFMHNLEQKEKDLEIEQLRNVELKKERDRSEALLLNILPAEVAEELKDKGSADAKLFNDVTVFFSDFKSFTTISEKLTPQQLVDELHECFSAFDNIIHKYGIEKIKTVGDAYLAVSGLPLANPNHASDMVNAAIEIQDFISTRVSKAPFGGLGAVRIGIHSGHVVAGIVGVKKFAYDIWGDTVNTAARMEQNGEAGKVNISEATYELVKDKFTTSSGSSSHLLQEEKESGKFQFEYRGEIDAKNKGKLKMYFVS